MIEAPFARAIAYTSATLKQASWSLSPFTDASITMPTAATQKLNGRHVLIVDDDQDILASMEIAVRSEGAGTVKAIDGSAAVLAVQQHNPDAVVLDMMLPKASGFVVLEKIMEMKDPPVVVMVTANQGKRHQEYAHNMGVNAYLNKPVPLNRLVDTLARLLEGRETRPRPVAAMTDAPPVESDVADNANDAVNGDSSE